MRVAEREEGRIDVKECTEQCPPRPPTQTQVLQRVVETAPLRILEKESR